MATTANVLGQFLGDDNFPVQWESEEEQHLLWIYDDLHVPQPVSPMFFDIGGCLARGQRLQRRPHREAFDARARASMYESWTEFAERIGAAKHGADSSPSRRWPRTACRPTCAKSSAMTHQ